MFKGWIRQGDLTMGVVRDGNNGRGDRKCTSLQIERLDFRSAFKLNDKSTSAENKKQNKTKHVNASDSAVNKWFQETARGGNRYKASVDTAEKYIYYLSYNSCFGNIYAKLISTVTQS